MQRTSRRLIHDCCHAVLHLPRSLGVVQKIIDRVSPALVPHDEAMAPLARHATVGALDETPWYCHNALHGLWTLRTPTVSLYLMHPHRSHEAFAALSEDWQGIVVSAGDGVSQGWGQHRPTCLAQLIRTVRGLSEKRAPPLAAGGTWALTALQTLCHMAKAPPTGGEWHAWYARLCPLIERYHARADDAGRLARRLQREVASLWVFLRASGVEPTNNRAESAVRFAVMWRKCSSGTESDKGNRWVERTLSLRQTCRQLGQAIFGVLVEAVTSCFQGRQPDLAWLYCTPPDPLPLPPVVAYEESCRKTIAPCDCPLVAGIPGSIVRQISPKIARHRQATISERVSLAEVLPAARTHGARAWMSCLLSCAPNHTILYRTLLQVILK
jgi:transposase